MIDELNYFLPWPLVCPWCWLPRIHNASGLFVTDFEHLAALFAIWVAKTELTDPLPCLLMALRNWIKPEASVIVWFDRSANTNSPHLNRVTCKMMFFIYAFFLS